MELGNHIQNEVGPLLVLNGDSAGLSGEQLNMVLLEVKDMVGNSGRLLDGVHVRIQIGDVDLAVVIGDTVKIKEYGNKGIYVPRQWCMLYRYGSGSSF